MSEKRSAKRRKLSSEDEQPSPSYHTATASRNTRSQQESREVAETRNASNNPSPSEKVNTRRQTPAASKKSRRSVPEALKSPPSTRTRSSRSKMKEITNQSESRIYSKGKKSAATGQGDGTVDDEGEQDLHDAEPKSTRRRPGRNSRTDNEQTTSDAGTKNRKGKSLDRRSSQRITRAQKKSQDEIEDDLGFEDIETLNEPQEKSEKDKTVKHPDPQEQNSRSWLPILPKWAKWKGARGPDEWINAENNSNEDASQDELGAPEENVQKAAGVDSAQAQAEHEESLAALKAKNAELRRYVKERRGLRHMNRTDNFENAEPPPQAPSEGASRSTNADQEPSNFQTPLSSPPTSRARSKDASTQQYIPTDPTRTLRNIALAKLTNRRPVPLTHIYTPHNQITHLIRQTVLAGEGNSLLVIGSRGTGKTAIINNVLQKLSTTHRDHFHVIRLNGFLQTDDKLALKEIWRQLGRERELDDEEEGTSGQSYADALARLLALLSHEDEGDPMDIDAVEGTTESRVARSVIFIIDEFDLFAARPRQTLLYNLFDVAQSRKAPIAVLGVTTRLDVAEGLEKRVKSRFSHRYSYVPAMNNLAEFRDVCMAAVRVEEGELAFEERAKVVGKIGEDGRDMIRVWNDAVEVC